jgi:cytidylate kinase
LSTPNERVVIVFGLAGSGKSTLAKRLSSEFGLRKVHPSGVMRDLLEGKVVDPEASRANDGFWETEEGARILEDRLSDDEPVDVAANDILLGEVEKGDVVIDSWSLPWLTNKGVRFYLSAPLEVRAERAAERGGTSPGKTAQLIDKKDNDTRQLFLRLYGFDIKTDHQVFDQTIDTSDLSADDVFHRVCGYLKRLWGL